MLNYLLSYSQRAELHEEALKAIAEKRVSMEQENKKCLEFQGVKKDGREVHLVIDYEAFKKLPKYKLKMIQDLF